jgi:FkbM family methyltransferase
MFAGVLKIVKNSIVRFIRNFPPPIYTIFLLGFSFSRALFLKRFIGRIDKLNSIYRVSLFQFNQPSLNVFIPSIYRADRFFSGIDTAFRNQLLKYNFLLPKNKKITIIDVGANIGEFALNFISNPLIKIIAIEPDPKAFECLVKNDITDRLIKHQILIHETESLLDFYLKTDDADSSIFEPDAWTNIISLPGCRLEQLINNTLKFDEIYIKIDAEGAEPEVLRSIGKSNYDKIKFISIDVGPERFGKNTKELCRKILKEMNFPNIYEHLDNILIASRLNDVDL